MRWVTQAVVFFSLVCSVISAEGEDEPSLRIMARSSVYNIGEKKAIYCEKKNIQEEISWYLPSGEVVEEKSAKNTRVFVERRSSGPDLLPLIIHPTKLSDTGNWTCKAGELSDILEIVVGEKVVIPQKFEKLVADEGKTIKLNCEAKGNPLPIVQWYNQDGQAIEEDPAKYVFSNRGDTYGLEIKKLTHEDAGEYMCKVTQKALSHYTSKTYKIVVHHRPILINHETKEILEQPNYMRTEEVFAVIGDIKNITCAAFASPLPIFAWFRRRNNFDKPIDAIDTVFNSEDGLISTLVLRMRSEEDKGQYKCTATNTKGSVTVIYDVTPGQRPSPPDNITFVSANVSHIMFNVTCSSCLFVTETSEPLDPMNLPVIAYNFEVTLYKEDYPAIWEEAESITVDIIDPSDTIFAVGPFPNTTTYHVRVSSVNAAGASEFVELDDTASTTSRAKRLIATMVFVILAIIAIQCY